MVTGFEFEKYKHTDPSTLLRTGILEINTATSHRKSRISGFNAENKSLIILFIKLSSVLIRIIRLIRVPVFYWLSI
jgi:hypothetical protein